MQDGDEAFQALLEQRQAAAQAWCRGDPGPLLEMTPQQGAASFFGPGGSVLTGAQAVREDYRTGSAAFGPGSTTELEILQQGHDGDLGFWTGVQYAEADLEGHADPVPMSLRITEVFKKTAAGWMLVHRHASMLRD